MHMYVHCSMISNSKDMESTQVPISDRLEKENVVHTMGQYAAIKRNNTMFIVGTWIILSIIFSQLTQEQKMKYHIFSLIGG